MDDTGPQVLWKNEVRVHHPLRGTEVSACRLRGLRFDRVHPLTVAANHASAGASRASSTVSTLQTSNFILHTSNFTLHTSPMSTPHAIIRFPSAVGIEPLGLWWSENVQVATDDNFVWARFSVHNELLMRQAQAMPADRFRVQGRWLVREGHQVAEGELPELDWQPISKVLQFQLPWISDAGHTAQLHSVHWKLARGGVERPPAATLIAWDQLTLWVDTAPQSRLRCLRYCLSPGDGQPRQALVLGTPIPPVEADYLVAIENVLIPAGFHWLPALDVSFVQRSFQLERDQWLVWQATDLWSIVDESILAPLTRGSVRMVSMGDDQS